MRQLPFWFERAEIRARNARCTAPGCGRPAARCDLDHTLAWDHDGLTLSASKPKAGPWNSPNRACRSGAPRPERTYVTAPTEYPM